MPLTARLPKGNVLKSVRDSCRDLIEKTQVSISSTGISQFVESLDPQEFEELSVNTPMRMPLKFPTTSDEINFITFIDLLNFGSGYRIPLHEMADRGAFDTIRSGAISFHIGGTPMTAQYFKEMNVGKVAEHFQLPIDREVSPPDKPYLTLTEPTELMPFASGIVDVLKSTGEFLESKGYKDMATFILDVTRPGASKPSAARLVEQLVHALPGLRDCYTIDGQEVYLFKKAQIIVYHLWLTFRDQDPDRFDFVDVTELTIFSDNVLPAMLEHLGVLQMPDTWLQQIKSADDIGEKKAIILRAAAVVACDEIVKLAKQTGPLKNMNTGELDAYLWRLGKKGDYRKVPRFAWRDTVMF